jgi:hypothetical protein
MYWVDPQAVPRDAIRRSLESFAVGLDAMKARGDYQKRARAAKK